MLPPIILDAGYFMPSRLFFGNLGTILLFAVIGTLWNAFTIGLSLWLLGIADLFGVEISLLEILLFSTLISAVDPVAVLAVFEEIHVNDILYIVVFGESLLNDAVTIVLYHMFEEYCVMGQDRVTVTEIAKGVASFPVVALGGTIIGILWGLMTGYVTKFTHHAMVIEPVFVFVMAYMSYLNAELFHMSGVLAITFCGITMKKYVEANISPNSSITVKYAMRMLSSSSETIIFMFLGVSTVHDQHVWNWWFVIMTILFCTLYRFLGVLWMTALANRFRLNKLNMVDQFVMSYGGLRGAVSFSLVLLIPEDAVGDENIRHMFVTTTIAVVFFTVFLQGITIKPFVECLNVKRAEERELNMNERLHERLMDHTLSVVEMIMGTTGQNVLRDKVKLLDETYIRPYLIRDYKGTSQAKILETYSKLEMQDALDRMKNQLKQHTVVVTVPSEPDSNEPEIEIPVVETKDLEDLDFEIPSRKISSINEGPVDLLSEDIFKPARRQRKMSYCRQMLDPKDLETEMIAKKFAQTWKAKTPQGQGGPRRKFGMSLGESPGVGAYFNPSFTMLEEIARDDGNRATPRRGSLQLKPLSLSTASPKLGCPDSFKKQRRYSVQTVSRPVPTLQDLQDGTAAIGSRLSPPSSSEEPPLRTSDRDRRLSPPSSSDPPVRTPSPKTSFETTIEEEETSD